MRVLVLLACLMAGSAAGAAETVRIGLLRTLSPAPLYLAMERGYFRDEGLDASFRFFEAAQPIAAAAVSGDIDVGITALTGGFFSLAGRGTLKVIGGGLHEQKGYEGTAVLVSKAAYEAGLNSLAKLPGHTLAITQYGSSFHYIAGRIAEREGFELKTVTLRPLQTLGNMMAAVRTGQVDATMNVASQVRPIVAAGEGHVIAWIGDVVPYQLTAVFAPSGVVEKRADMLQRFARAYAHGVADYREAFLRLDAAGKPVVDAKTDAAIAPIQAYVFTGDPAAREKIIDGAGYYDEGGRLDTADVAAQLRWFVAQGLVKTAVDPAEVMDTRFLGALPAK
ncbi:MAG: ABC transporter substrate-binding protein [Janthinobacterium lividum]